MGHRLTRDPPDAGTSLCRSGCGPPHHREDSLSGYADGHVHVRGQPRTGPDLCDCSNRGRGSVAHSEPSRLPLPGDPAGRGAALGIQDGNLAPAPPPRTQRWRRASLRLSLPMAAPCVTGQTDHASRRRRHGTTTLPSVTSMAAPTSLPLTVTGLAGSTGMLGYLRPRPPLDTALPTCRL